MPYKKVLIIEDDEAIAEAIFEYFVPTTFRVRLASDGKSGLAICKQWRPDVAVLDLGLPHISGMDVLACLRSDLPSAKVCIVSGKGRVEDRLAGLEAGADDYLLKPFSGRELVARVTALSRRDRLREGSVMEMAGLRLDVEGTLTKDGKSVKLSRTQAALLRYLMERPGRVIDRNELLDTVWGGKDRYPNIVDATVEGVRTKLRQLCRTAYLHTAYRSGYYFEPEGVLLDDYVFRRDS